LALAWLSPDVEIASARDQFTSVIPQGDQPRPNCFLPPVTWSLLRLGLQVLSSGLRCMLGLLEAALVLIGLDLMLLIFTHEPLLKSSHFNR
jgi:hypothetical protein